MMRKYCTTRMSAKERKIGSVTIRTVVRRYGLWKRLSVLTEGRMSLNALNHPQRGTYMYILYIAKERNVLFAVDRKK